MVKHVQYIRVQYASSEYVASIMFIPHSTSIQLRMTFRIVILFRRCADDHTYDQIAIVYICLAFTNQTVNCVYATSLPVVIGHFMIIIILLVLFESLVV